MVAELRVLIDWANTGQFDLPTHPVTGVNLCDVSDHLVSVRYDRGKSSITRGFAAGKAVIELTNDDDLYSPWNRYSLLTDSGSPLVPDPTTLPDATRGSEPHYLRPGHLVRVDVLDVDIHGAITATYRRFTGWIERLVSRGGRAESRTCTIYVIDAIGIMANIRLSLAMQTNQTAEDIIGAILDRASLLRPKPNTWFTFDMQGAWNGLDVAPLFTGENAFVQRDIDAMADVVPYAWWDQSTVKAALDEVATAMGASYFVDGAGVVTVHNRYHEYSAARSLGNSKAPAQHILQADLLEDEQELAVADVANVIHVTSQAYTPQGAPSTLWSLQSAQVPIRMEPGEYVPLHVEFTGPASAVTTPVATTDYTASENSDGSGADKTGSLAPNFVAFGASADFNLQNTDTVPIFIQTLKVRGTQLDAQLEIVDERVDDQSQADYHYRELAVTSPLIQSRGLAASIATQIALARGPSRATPKLRLLNDQSAAILGAQLADSVEVRYAAGNWSPIVDGDPEDVPTRFRRYHLWGISDVIRPAMPAGIDIESTWLLTEALVQAGARDFFRFDVGPGFDRGILIW